MLHEVHAPNGGIVRYEDGQPFAYAPWDDCRVPLTYRLTGTLTADWRGKVWFGHILQTSNELLARYHAHTGWLPHLGTVAITDLRPEGELIEEVEVEEGVWMATTETDHPDIVRVDLRGPDIHETVCIVTTLYPWHPIAGCRLILWGTRVPDTRTFREIVGPPPPAAPTPGAYTPPRRQPVDWLKGFLGLFLLTHHD